MVIKLDVPRLKQRFTKSTGSCGPTSIQQIRAYYDDHKPLKNILESIDTYDKGGTSFDGQLGTFLIKQGYKVKIYSQDTKIFDPTWFKLNNEKLIRKLRLRLVFERDKFHKYAIRGFISYLKKKGKIVFEPVTKELLINILKKKIPVAVGVDDCLLYRFKRCYRAFYNDDIRGKVWGHELVIAGYKKDKFFIVDPFDKNPFSKKGEYWYDADKLVSNINSMGGYIIVVEK